MSEEKSAKVLVQRPANRQPGDEPHSVWADPVESAELELVSTQTLKQILTARDDSGRKSIESLATTANDGVLVRDTATGMFKIIDDDELQEILAQQESLPNLSRPVDVTLEPLRDYESIDHLSLVSTIALRRVLTSDGNDSTGEPDEKTDRKIDRGFNPYDSG